MTEPTVMRTFDWDTFTDRFWDRRPVLFKGLSDPPFDEREVFHAAVLGTRTDHPLALPPNVQITIERRQQTRPGDHLPEFSDGSLEGYQERMARQLDGRRYALVVHGFHAFHQPQVERERAFYAGLWERVGQPLTGAITTLFHGTYEHSPVGVHLDRFATFMYALKGRKRMRFWPSRPWSEPVATMLDYEAYLSESIVAEVEPGDLLYWPSTYYHVGESAGGEPATSVNVGVPRDRHSVAYELDDLLGPDLATRAVPDSTSGLPESARGRLFASRVGTDDEVPEELARGVRALVALTQEDRLDERLADVSLEHWTSGGFLPAPPPLPSRKLEDDTFVRAVAPILLTGDRNGCRCAANGHVVRIAAAEADIATMIAPLRAGRTVSVGELLAYGLHGSGDEGPGDDEPGDDEPARGASRADRRSLLETLESFHALVRR